MNMGNLNKTYPMQSKVHVAMMKIPSWLELLNDSHQYHCKEFGLDALSSKEEKGHQLWYKLTVQSILVKRKKGINFDLKK